MTLTQLFTAIANAIRAKKGTSETIVAENFPTEIASITTGHLDNTEYTEANDDLDDILENTTVPSGTLSITENGSYDVTNYTGANVNVVSEYNVKIDTSKPTTSDMYVGIKALITEIDNIDTSSITNMPYFFSYCRNLKSIPFLNTSNVTNMNSMFNYCTELTTIPLLDTSNVIYMSGMFNYCSGLTSFPLLNMGKVTNINSMFTYCTNLTTIPLLNIEKVIYMNNTFLGCSSLTNESLNNILAMCARATAYINQGTNMTLRYIGLTSAQATTCTGLSNYQAFLDAGWTTGY